jgi:hypothetical protein
MPITVLAATSSGSPCGLAAMSVSFRQNTTSIPIIAACSAATEDIPTDTPSVSCLCFNITERFPFWRSYVYTVIKVGSNLLQKRYKEEKNSEENMACGAGPHADNGHSMQQH